MKPYPTSRNDVALPGNGHVDRIGRLVGQPVQLSGRFVAKNGSRAGREDSCPQLRAATGNPGERCIDAQMDLSPPVTLDSGLDHVGREPGLERL
jgi:hypothetical protein